MARIAHSEHIVIIGCRSIIAFFIHSYGVPSFSYGVPFFISNQHSAQEFGEVKKLAQRGSNPGPSRRRVIRLLLPHSIDNYHSGISPSNNIVCCIFATESACKRGSAEYSTCSRGRTFKYLRFRDVRHQMWRAKVFSRLERTHSPGRKISKSRGVAMTSDSGRWFSS